MPSLHERVAFLREAGEVRRCHTTPLSREYTVGLHSYNAVNLLLLLHPAPSLNLVRALMWHDAPERLLGDLPATAKWASIDLTTAYEALEARIAGHFGIQVLLTDEEREWVNAMDSLELYLWSCEEIRAGNLAFVEYKNRLLERFGRYSRGPGHHAAMQFAVLYGPTERTSNVVPD